MAIPILLPKVSFVVTEGKIIEWLKKPGEEVTKGELLLVIETEKASVDVEAPGSGILGSELAPVGIIVPVTTTIGYILAEGELCPRLELLPGQPVPAAPAKEQSEGEPGKSDEAQWTKVSPLARRIAKEFGVDLARVKGTGPNGRILQEDVQAYKKVQDHQQDASLPEAKPAEPVLLSQATTSVPSETQELSNLQRITAERMVFSFQNAPHFYLDVQVDMSQVVLMRQAYLSEVEEKVKVRLSFTDILIFAVSRAIKAHAALNACFDNGKLTRLKDINICLAVDTPRGLTAPVVHNAEKLPLIEIARQRHELVERAQNNRLTPEDLNGGTFTISNLGMFGIDSFHAIINPPQAAILATGKITKRPIVVNDVLEVMPTMWMSISVDHRVADGAVAARFLQTLTTYLENPYQMVKLD